MQAADRSIADTIDDLHVAHRQRRQNVITAELLDIISGYEAITAQPELGALGLLDPDAQNLLRAFRQDAEGDVDRLVAHEAFVPDLDPNGIKEHQRVANIEWPVLPFRHFVQYRVGDRRDQIGGNIDAIEFLQMAADLANRHAAGVHRNDLLIEITHTHNESYFAIAVIAAAVTVLAPVAPIVQAQFSADSDTDYHCVFTIVFV
jgi:hypothetical protein